MISKTTWVLVIAVFVLAAVSAAFGYHEYQAIEASRAQIVATELQPIATLLKENLALIQELNSDPFTEKDSGILEAYLAKIRRDGVPKHADMKQKLDTLAENNTAIVTLIKAHSPHATTPAFSVEADKFRNYASAWRDRWNSVMELFMAGGNYPAAEVPPPAGFLQIVQAETAAAR
jgi:long-subunit fatty acid transport protein